jgi:hypothetical protein
MNKKTYYYDFNKTIPNNDQLKTESTPNGLPPQDVLYQAKPDSTPEPVEPPVETIEPPTKPLPPSQPQQGALPTIVFVALGVIALATVSLVTWSILPENYAECTRFPGSEISNTLPPQCSTFYGAVFTQTNNLVDRDFGFDDERQNDLLGEIEEATPSATPTPTRIPEMDTDQTESKGGQATVTPAPTTKPQPTPAPSSTKVNVNASNTYIKNRWPDQNLIVWLPDNFSGNSAIRNLDTKITTINITGSNHKVIEIRLQPDWTNTGNAKDQSITFMLKGNIGVIKQDSLNQTQYFFQKSNTVYVVSCYLQNVDTCDKIVKSIEN